MWEGRVMVIREEEHSGVVLRQRQGLVEQVKPAQVLVRPGTAAATPPHDGLRRLSESRAGWGAGLIGVAWTRILSELVFSGLLQAAFANFEEFKVAMRELVLRNPINLALTAADCAPCQKSCVFVRSGADPVPSTPGRRLHANLPG